MYKNISFSIIVILATTVLLSAGCAGNNKSKPLNVDELLTNATSLVGKTVVVEGLCTHVCSKSGMKLFLQGSDGTKTLRAESGAALGKFDPASVDRKVRVRGKLAEVQIVKNNSDIHATSVAQGDSCKTEGIAEKSYYIETESYQIID
ncbi:hypothetical protein SDC9_171395 [bioreactor metagenome]|uniref:Lipoprotein n=1 Tax=bioreactor metagenome TaxID=1076179 RepID=A0A645GDC0_9ZZZZ